MNLRHPERTTMRVRLTRPRRLLPVALLSAAFSTACGTTDAGEAAAVDADLLAAPGTVTAFVGVSVIPMDTQRTLENQTVIVVGDRVATIGPAGATRVPDGAAVIDGSGKWLVPGLGEMHAHIPPDHDAAERVLFLYLSQGITTARGMLGQPAHLALRDELATGKVLGPRLFTTGPSLNGQSIPDADSARRAVLHQRELGYDLMKIHPGLTREEYDAIVETGNEVGLTWAGHVPADVGLARALEAGQTSIDHLDQYMEAIVADGTDISQSAFFGLNLAASVDTSKIADVARATAEAGVWNVPTESLIENMASPTPAEEMARGPAMRYMPPRTVAAWIRQKREFVDGPDYSAETAARAIDVRRRVIKALHDAGAGLLLGSDAPQVFQVPGFSLQHELELLVASGLTPYEALRAGTYSVADYFDALEDFGTVETGRSADLVLLDADPLLDIHNVARRAGVMVRGRWISAREIQTRLEAIAEEYAGEDSGASETPH